MAMEYEGLNPQQAEEVRDLLNGKDKTGADPTVDVHGCSLAVTTLPAFLPDAAPVDVSSPLMHRLAAAFMTLILHMPEASENLKKYSLLAMDNTPPPGAEARAEGLDFIGGKKSDMDFAGIVLLAGMEISGMDTDHNVMFMETDKGVLIHSKDTGYDCMEGDSGRRMTISLRHWVMLSINAETRGCSVIPDIGEYAMARAHSDGWKPNWRPQFA